MALEKTWWSKANMALTHDGTYHTRARSWLFNLKETLIGRAVENGGWVVVGSSDGTTASVDDGVDRWSSEAKIVYPATTSSARSWIVLRSPAPYVYLTMGFSWNTGALVWYRFSVNPFTGGSTTAVPTATNEWGCLNGAWNDRRCYLGYTSLVGTNGWRQHVSMCTDGSFVVVSNEIGRGTFAHVWIFSRLAETPAGDPNPTFSWWGNGYGSISDYTYDSGGWKSALLLWANANYGSATASDSCGWWSSTYYSGASASRASFAMLGVAPASQNTPTENSSNWPLFSFYGPDDGTPSGTYLGSPLWVFVQSSSGTQKYLKGRIPDVYCAPQLPAGTCAPSTGTPDRIAAGFIWVPMREVPDMT